MKLIQIVCVNLIILFFMILSCQRQATKSQELAQKWIELGNTGNLDITDEFFAPGFLCHYVDTYGEKDIEAYKGWIITLRTMYPDLTITMDELIRMSDRIVIRWTINGTNTGPGLIKPPTGKKIKLSGASIIKITDGKISEEWTYLNETASLLQLGFTLIPPTSE